MMVPHRLLLCFMLLGLSTAKGPDSCKNSTSYRHGPPIESSQDLNSSSFTGQPANRKSLGPRFTFYPKSSLLHTDGNTGSSDYPGPLGNTPTISSSTNTINIMVWGPNGTMTAGYGNASSSGIIHLGLAAVDPVTLDILSSWYPPVMNQTIGFAYMEYIEETNDILLNTKEGNIYVVHRDDVTCPHNPTFTTTRIINLTDTMRGTEQLLNSMYDTAGNIWFTTGGIGGTGDSEQNSTTYGYITPSGKIIATHLENEIVENGLAISGLNVFMNTGPSGAANVPNATGYFYSFTANAGPRGDGITTRWRVGYDAGSGLNKGVTSRGSGSTPALLNDTYIAITDKADSQIHVNVYHQSPQPSPEKQFVCSVPLFTPGQSNNDNAIITQFDGKVHGMMIQNDFKGPPLYAAQPGATAAEINGDWNDMSVMPGGMARVDVNEQGECSLRWTSPLAVKAVSILSTNTGLLYSYVQDTERAAKGEYIWYVAGIDWDTGETVFQIQTGEGGTFNDNWIEGTLGPDGTFYQTVLGGVVAVKDGK